MANGHIHARSANRVVHVRQGYNNRGCSLNNTCCCRCLLITAAVIFLIIGTVVTAVGHGRKSFWDESDDWCSFCKKHRLETEKSNATCRVVGPIFLGLGGMLLFFIICQFYITKKPSDGNQEMTATTTYPPATTTTSYPPPQMYPNAPPGGMAHYPPPQMTMGYPSPQPAVAPIPPQPSNFTGYPPPGSQYPAAVSGGALPSAPQYPSAPALIDQPAEAPPSYDQVMTKGY